MTTRRRPLPVGKRWLTFVAHAARRAAALRDRARHDAPRSAHPLFAILERDHATTRSVAHYARAADVSPRRLGELLVDRVGKPTKQLIDERVVLGCKRRLVHANASVKELADELGFDEPTNLVKFFRRHTQTTPIAFRAAQRNALRR